jgi:hypothetical protein
MIPIGSDGADITIMINNSEDHLIAATSGISVQGTISPQFYFGRVTSKNNFVEISDNIGVNSTKNRCSIAVTVEASGTFETPEVGCETSRTNSLGRKSCDVSICYPLADLGIQNGYISSDSSEVIRLDDHGTDNVCEAYQTEFDSQGRPLNYCLHIHARSPSLQSGGGSGYTYCKAMIGYIRID